MSNEKGQASRVTPGLSQRLRKTHPASQARRTDGQAIRLLIGKTTDRFPFPVTTHARKIHHRLKDRVLCSTHFTRPIARTSVRRRVSPEVRATRDYFLPSLFRPRNLRLGSRFATIASGGERRRGRDLRPPTITTMRLTAFLFPRRRDKPRFPGAFSCRLFP